LIMLCNFGSFALVEKFGSDFGRMFSYGFRFDLRVATLAHAPFLVIGLLLLPWPSLCHRYLGKLHYVASCLGIIAVIAAVTNYYYYATYDRFFGLQSIINLAD